MKTLNVSDEDYDTLMELSKELQLQDNHIQAFPYFWEPASERLKTSIHNEGTVFMVYDNDAAESYTAADYAEHKPELYRKFRIEIIDEHPIVDKELEILGLLRTIKFDTELESDWEDYLRDQCDSNIDLYSQDWEDESEHNPSLFLSDVQQFIEHNKHHLGRNPHTYARSVWRMPKMKKLIEAMYRLNPQPIDKVNDAARRFIFT